MENDITVREYLNKDNWLYHYTSENGILGIFKKDKFILQLSKANSLNDKSEGKDFYKCLDDVCKEMLEEKKIDIDFFYAINSLYTDKVGTIAEKTEYSRSQIVHYRRMLNDSKFDFFIMSFSTEKDCLPMWNYYTNAGTQGYSIKIDKKKLKSVIETKSEKYGISDFDFYNVIYSTDEKHRIIQERIEQAYFSNRINTIVDMINEYQYLFKHTSFEYEKEVRLIIKVPKIKNQNCNGLGFRARSGMIVPFLQLEFDKSPSNLVYEIMIGPLSNDSIAEENLKMYLTYNGYNNYRITSSDIPIRF
ncbi:MAG: DUF2971 domain-containing protein [Huintestinicola sp.]